MPGKGKQLVIVESPAKARSIGRYLGSDYDVQASVGHVRDLPVKEMGVDVEGGFEPEWVVMRGKGKIIKDLKQRARSAEAVILATDPDREGEAIAWHLADELGYQKAPERFRRVQFREITRSAVQDAMEHPGQIDDRKVDAQVARRVLDRLVGYKASPFLWKPIRPGLSAGRVQTVALRLIAEREDEIRAFEAEEYWSITADLEKDGQVFQARLHQIQGKAFKLTNEAEATAVVDDVKGVPWGVTDIRRRERRKNPFAPFTTSTLQQEAAKRLRFSARRTMQTAQRLYEGLEVGGRGTVGLITYMRTDSTRVSASAVEAARGWIASEFGDSYQASSPRYYGKTSQKGAQEAHEAIRPADPTLLPREASAYLTEDQARLYELIWLRFVASQMAPAVYDTTTVDFHLIGSSGRHNLFRATGSLVKFQGFTRLYLEATEDGDHRRLDDLEPLPDIEEGDVVDLKALTPNQHFTQPPPRFSEASLVKELEKLGIGRPSTYASIISTIVDKGYVELEKRRFTPTSLGEIVSKFLVKVLPNEFDVDFTSRMEAELDQVEEGEMDWRAILAEWYPRFEERLAHGEAISEDVVKEILEADGEKCDKCGRPMLVKFNRFGEFLGCSGYPECRNTRSLAGSKAADQFLGNDPVSGLQILAKVGPYGPYVEREGEDGGKPKRASLPEGTDITEVPFETALKYLSLPRKIGEDSEGTAVYAGLGRYGPFVRRKKTFASLDSHDQMFTVTLEDAVKLIEAKEKGGGRPILKELGEHPDSGVAINVYKGRFGPYVSDGSVNATIPKDMEPDEVDMELAVELLAAKAKRGGGRRGGGRKTTKKTGARKSSAGKKSSAKKKTAKKKTTKKKTTTKKSTSKKSTSKKSGSR
jgi:DNA topoisomerase-1